MKNIIRYKYFNIYSSILNLSFVVILSIIFFCLHHFFRKINLSYSFIFALSIHAFSKLAQSWSESLESIPDAVGRRRGRLHPIGCRSPVTNMFVLWRMLCDWVLFNFLFGFSMHFCHCYSHKSTFITYIVFLCLCCPLRPQPVIADLNVVFVTSLSITLKIFDM